MSSADELRILIVDEEEPLAHVLRLGLEMEGWAVEVATTGAEALHRAPGADVVLLDMMLPDRLGTEVVAGLRAARCDAHVIFLTGRNDHEDRMRAYAAGADDYMTKPFSVEEVVERVGAAARRRGRAPGSLRIGDLVLDVRDGLAWRGDELLDVSPLEVELLAHLARSDGALSTRELADAVGDGDARMPSSLAERLLAHALASVNAAGEALVVGGRDGWAIRGDLGSVR